MNRPIETVAADLAFLEGPRWHDGALYASDIFGERVYRFESSGDVNELCVVPGRPAGLGFDASGGLLIASMVDRKVLRYADGDVDLVVDLADTVPGDLNDMVVDRRGGVYLGNFGSRANDGEKLRPTKILYLTPGGSIEHVGEDVIFPNGMVITPDGSTLLVAETYAHRVSAFDIGADGALTNLREWASFAPYPRELSTTHAAHEAGLPLPDGIWLDSEGALWMGDAAGTGAVRVAEGGEILDQVETPGLAVYAVTLGGPEMSTLYMCAAPAIGTWDPTRERRGAMLRCEVDVPGLPV